MNGRTIAGTIPLAAVAVLMLLLILPQVTNAQSPPLSTPSVFVSPTSGNIFDVGSVPIAISVTGLTNPLLPGQGTCHDNVCGAEIIVAEEPTGTFCPYSTSQVYPAGNGGGPSGNLNDCNTSATYPQQPTGGQYCSNKNPLGLSCGYDAYPVTGNPDQSCSGVYYTSSALSTTFFGAQQAQYCVYIAYYGVTTQPFPSALGSALYNIGASTALYPNSTALNPQSQVVVTANPNPVAPGQPVYFSLEQLYGGSPCTITARGLGFYSSNCGEAFLEYGGLAPSGDSYPSPQGGCVFPYSQWSGTFGSGNPSYTVTNPLVASGTHSTGIIAYSVGTIYPYAPGYDTEPSFGASYDAPSTTGNYQICGYSSTLQGQGLFFSGGQTYPNFATWASTNFTVCSGSSCPTPTCAVCAASAQGGAACIDPTTGACYPASSTSASCSSTAPSGSVYCNSNPGSGVWSGPNPCPPGAVLSSCTGLAPPTVTLGPLTATICSIYTVINTVLFILALTIMLIGGTLYAGSHLLPGQSRGVVQGYAMGMVLGGVVASIIAVVAPFILSVATNVSLTTILAACP